MQANRDFSMVVDVVKGTLLGTFEDEAVGEIINIAQKKNIL